MLGRSVLRYPAAHILNAAALELFRCGYYGMGCSVCVCDRSLMQQTHRDRQTGESGDAD